MTLILGIIEGPDQGWASGIVVGAFVSSAVLWGTWVLVGLRTRHPMLDPRLLTIPMLVASCVGMMLAFFGNFGLFYVNGSLLQYVHDFSVLQTGLGIMPMVVPLLVLPRFVLRFVARFGLAAVLGFAFATVSTGMFLLSLNTSTSYLAYALSLVIIGTGMAPTMPALTVEMTEALPRAQAGVGGGLQSATRELGSALGVAVIGTIIREAHRQSGDEGEGAEHEHDPSSHVVCSRKTLWVDAGGLKPNTWQTFERLGSAWEQAKLGLGDEPVSAAHDEPGVVANPRRRARTPLTESQVDAIRTARANGESVVSICRRFNVHRMTVWTHTKQPL